MVKLANSGVDYSVEDVVCHAWDEILRLYFPNPTSPDFPLQWNIERDSFPVTSSSVSGKDLDIMIVKKVITPEEAVSSGPPAPIRERDCIWVVCKAPPEEDNPNPWREAIEETIERLDILHPDHKLFVIIAIGLEYMKFYWDGPRTYPTRPYDVPMLVEGSSEWILDDRLQVNDFIPGAPFFDQKTGNIYASGALSLDFWTRGGADCLPTNYRACESLEMLFFVINNSPDPGCTEPTGLMTDEDEC